MHTSRFTWSDFSTSRFTPKESLHPSPGPQVSLQPYGNLPRHNRRCIQDETTIPQPDPCWSDNSTSRSRFTHSKCRFTLGLMFKGRFKLQGARYNQVEVDSSMKRQFHKSLHPEATFNKSLHPTEVASPSIKSLQAPASLSNVASSIFRLFYYCCKPCKALV